MRVSFKADSILVASQCHKRYSPINIKFNSTLIGPQRLQYACDAIIKGIIIIFLSGVYAFYQHVDQYVGLFSLVNIDLQNVSIL